MAGRRVAIMQPYFYPYAGYFRLFAAVDRFVVYDCVQFPRRGRVHRCQLPAAGSAGGPERWLTLPLEPSARSTRIRDLAFASDAPAIMHERTSAWSRWFDRDDDGRSLRRTIDDCTGRPVDYLERHLRRTLAQIGIECEFVRSSSFGIPEDVRGQERILAIAEAAGASEYVNLSGGASLYDAPSFAARGIRLRILQPYEGAYPYMIPALLDAEPDAIRHDVVDAVRFHGDRDAPVSVRTDR